MKPKDYINKKAQEEALKAFGATQLNSTQEAGTYFVGKINASRTKITDPATKKEYDLTFTGNPREFELAQRLSNNTAYVDARKNNQMNVDGAMKKNRLVYFTNADISFIDNLNSYYSFDIMLFDFTLGVSVKLMSTLDLPLNAAISPVNDRPFQITPRACFDYTGNHLMVSVIYANNATDKGTSILSPCVGSITPDSGQSIESRGFDLSYIMVYKVYKNIKIVKSQEDYTITFTTSVTDTVGLDSTSTIPANGAFPGSIVFITGGSPVTVELSETFDIKTLRYGCPAFELSGDDIVITLTGASTWAYGYNAVMAYNAFNESTGEQVCFFWSTLDSPLSDSYKPEIDSDNEVIGTGFITKLIRNGQVVSSTNQNYGFKPQSYGGPRTLNYSYGFGFAGSRVQKKGLTTYIDAGNSISANNFILPRIAYTSLAQFGNGVPLTVHFYEEVEGVSGSGIDQNIDRYVTFRYLQELTPLKKTVFLPQLEFIGLPFKYISDTICLFINSSGVPNPPGHEVIGTSIDVYRVNIDESSDYVKSYEFSLPLITPAGNYVTPGNFLQDVYCS